MASEYDALLTADEPVKERTSPYDALLTASEENQKSSRVTGLIEPGNVDLSNRPHVQNADGSVSTVRSISFNQDGKEILIPTVSDEGTILSNKDAIKRYQETGKHLGVFDTPANATAFAVKLHDTEAAKLSNPASNPAPLTHRLFGDTAPPEDSYIPGEHPIAENAAAALIDTAKGFVPHSVKDVAGLLTPVVGAFDDVKKNVNVLRDIAAGREPEEAFREHMPESFALKDAEATPAFSKERFAAGFGTLAQMGMAAGIVHGMAPKPSLTERVFPETASKIDTVEPPPTPDTDAAVQAITPEVPIPALIEPVEAQLRAIAAKEPTPEVVTIEAYRGEPLSGTTAGDGAHKFYSAKAETAQGYAGKEGTVKQETLTFENPLRADNWQDAKTKMGLPIAGTPMPDLLDAVAKAGHDGIIWKHHGQEEYVKLSRPTEPAPASTAPEVVAPEPPSVSETPSTSAEALKTETANDWTQATLPELKMDVEKSSATPPDSSAVGITAPGTAQLQQAGSAISGVAKNVLSAVRNIPKFGDFRRSILDWSARNQRSSGEILKAQKDITASITNPIKRDAITNWIQAGGDDAVLQQRAAGSKNDKLKRGYEAALALTPEEKALAGKVRQTYDTLLNRAKSYGIEVNEIENYVNQIWKRQPLKEFSASSNRKLSTSIRFAKQRYYDSFFHGEEAGLKPETKDISKLLPIYINEVNNAIASKQLVADLSKGKASDGRPLVAPRGSARLIEGEGDKAGVQLVFPESATKDTLDYKALEQPALHNWKWVGTAEDGTTTLVKGDLAVHPEAYSHLKNVLGQSAIREWWHSPSENPLSNIPKSVVKFLVDDVQQVGKATMLGFISPFHMVQEATHAIGHRINPFGNIPKIDLSDPVHYDAAQHGLMLLPDRVSANQFREGLDGSSRNLLTNVLGKAGGKVGAKIKEWSDGFQNYLFHDYIPGLKLKTYSHILDRNMERYAGEISKGEVSEDQVKYLSAQQSNAAYGHLNYADMGRNPTIQHLMQTFLLAPDFLEARGKFASQAIKPSKAGREQLVALATLAATQYVLARTLNKTLDDDYHWNSPFDVIVGNRRYGMRSVPADIEHAFSDSRRFVSGRLSPLIGRGLLEGLSGVNYRSEPTTAAETLTNIVSGMVPLTLQPATRGLSETGKDNPVSPVEQLLGSLGLHVSRFSPVSEVYQRAKEWTDEHGKDYGITAERGTYPRSKYQQLRYALEDGDFDKAKSEIQRLTTEEKIGRKDLDQRFKMGIEHPFTGTKNTDKIFRKSLDERGQKVFDAALERRKLLLDRYRSVR